MDYKQTSTTGTSWHRFHFIGISNPRSGNIVVNCHEQQVFLTGDQEVLLDVPGFNFVFDPNINIPLLDPVTSEPVGGSVTGLQVYQYVHSYVLEEAKKRDIRIQVEAETEAARLAQLQT